MSVSSLAVNLVTIDGEYIEGFTLVFDTRFSTPGHPYSIIWNDGGNDILFVVDTGSLDVQGEGDLSLNYREVGI